MAGCSGSTVHMYGPYQRLQTICICVFLMPLMCDQRHKNDADTCCLKTQILPIHVYCTVAYCVVVQAPFALCQCTAVQSEASRLKQQPRKHWLTFACGMYCHSGSTSLLTIIGYAGSEVSLCSIIILNVEH